MNVVLIPLNKLQAEAKQIETMRGIKERPQMLAPLILAYEATDGNVKTV